MTDNFWKDKYPVGVSSEINPDEYQNIQAVLKQSCERFADKPAFSNLGKTLTYGELYKLSGDFAAYLQQNTDLQPGDRIAVQLPNLIQYPIVVFGAMRAGLIVVNTNPLYTAREMEHQFNDAGAKALVCLANMAHLAEEVLPKTGIKHVVITEVADMLPPLKRMLINAVVKHVKKMVPAYSLPKAVKLNDALALGRGKAVRDVSPSSDEVAVLQYTGGTTGVAKGAMLTHRNIVANMLQCKALMGSNLNDGSEVLIAPLPLYHIYAFTFHCMAMMLSGNHNILISNPRDLPAMIKDLSKYRFSGFVGLNTLFVALCNSEDFRKLDFSALKVTLSGGMALQLATAERWKQVTGCPICEGYGLTETSPVASVNPIEHIQIGTIGIPVPSTQFKVINDDGQDLAQGEIGELCIKGPQVMKGYWQRPEATAEVIDAEGWFKSGDIGVVQEDGYIRIVDRKKDMILVSGFNVYPNELEDVLAGLPGVLQCAAIGVPDEKSGEAIKLFVVVKPGESLTKEQVMQHMHDNLTGYKRPKSVEFRDSLPTTNVGKILRRELRDEELRKLGHKK
ncbi:MULTISPECIES: long-chain-fatty-acid--CoA ligase FadD1 [Stutzerimonas]|jgi:long-chain acyl-CoA synthetase|uniref:long-chain-fatty-acid--CoA ligase FadD1 n=1 Tax=Stutzerimonas TaxID=2901164 RepID=UPI00052D8AA4|nr:MULTISPECIES: long-chain-fatty-acid--CoA ligase FadD1 [Stutzerimonas stutzeri subgroup]MAF88321.1 long-chain fatty acid--CoA ligase [Pseudomonas sp.]MBU0838729.1 long-chain-fatty-acid--CoA ligase FadD1 [Gammaproteobacteria bacterium]MCB4794637.1 long-chain-fatty-acid--CoA ligase FadD1 [Pseudomonas sp. NP21570]RRU74563.1 long-chain fatty acid--CoA ligase [Stutzerimonas xanthomarina]KKJ95231.1 long-chain fatty acid--CoA ligase [Stutzerimonas stutzeri]|tara:strand:+ start:7217 stop:8908 length:1692 start_codon:yes stop_codon:yes gene_type:complete